MDGCSCEPLLPDDLFGVDDHTHALVQLRRPRRVLGVDSKADAPLATRVKLAEAVQEQRLRQAAPAPFPAHSERPDPTAARSLRIVAGCRNSGVSVAHHEPK